MAQAQNTDLPLPTANLQTLPAGSYVIAMDNTNQLNNSGVFNYKAYGLVVTLLNSSKKINWVITAGKAKDGIDFTVNSTKIKPTAGSAASYNFKAGPFVIFAADTTGVATLIDGFNSGISNANDKIKVYQTNADVTADIRYDLTGFVPKAAILTDGGNQAIHTTYMSTCNIPSTNYQTATGSDLLTKCYTFASEPHNSNTGPMVDDAIAAIKRFVEFGGNFLAQCEAVQTYENNVLGRFQTTTGITDANSTAGTAISYPNPDLSYTQYEGSYSISKAGSLQNWRINAASANNFHKHARANADTTVIGASVSKHKSGAGGLVFYIGNHRFDDQLTTLTSINGLRMYMNAFLTPVSIADSCTIGTGYMDPLGIRLTSFQASLNEQQVRLMWYVAGNEDIRQFEIERSSDGSGFSRSAVVFGNNNTGNETYQHTEIISSDKIFYRLKITSKNGKVIYSGIILLQTRTEKNPDIKIISNPVNDKLIFEFRAGRTVPVIVRIIDLFGNLQLKQMISSTEGNNVISVSLPSALQTGMYIAEVSSDHFRYIAKFVKQ
jgi:hypothetical protein